MSMEPGRRQGLMGEGPAPCSQVDEGPLQVVEPLPLGTLLLAGLFPFLAVQVV
jgi:hypothetical protein